MKLLDCQKLLISFFLLIFSFSCTPKNKEKNILRLGYMLNVTHATAIVGIEKGIFKKELGRNINFKPVEFVVGNSIIDAFITNQIDLAYVGPGPFINAIYRGVPLALLANAANGGTTIVGARCNVPLQDSLRIAVPQFGNTQDLILRAYLKKNKLAENAEAIIVHALPPQNIESAFYTMSIDAACLPEPWGTIVIKKKLCSLLIDEKKVLNNGDYSTTLLIASKKFAKENPEVLQSFLKAHRISNDILVKDIDEASKTIAKSISKKTGHHIDMEVIDKSLKRCMFVNSLNLLALREMAEAGIKAGYYKKTLLSKLENIIIN